MKKNIIIAAAAALALTFTACQKEDVIVPGESPVTNARVKTTSDLHNTNWTYTVTYSDFLTGLMGSDLCDVENLEDESMSFGLNFDGTYAHFSFPENVMAFGGDEGELAQISSVSYAYAYDGTTHTGYLDGVADDEEAPAQLQFTYDDATDAITFVLPMVFAEDGTPANLTLVFQRNE